MARFLRFTKCLLLNQGGGCRDQVAFRLGNPVVGLRKRSDVLCECGFAIRLTQRVSELDTNMVQELLVSCWFPFLSSTSEVYHLGASQKWRTPGNVCSMLFWIPLEPVLQEVPAHF